MKPVNSIVINALSDAVTQTSAAFDTWSMYRVSAQAFFSDGTAAGALKLQASNDISTANNLAIDQAPIHWNDIPNSSQTVTAGASVLIPSMEIGYRWIRAVWTPSAGAGNITVSLYAQGL